MFGVREGCSRHQHTNLLVFLSIRLVVGGATKKNPHPSRHHGAPFYHGHGICSRPMCERAALALSLMRGACLADIIPSDERPPRTTVSSLGGAVSFYDVCSELMPQGMGSCSHRHSGRSGACLADSVDVDC